LPDRSDSDLPDLAPDCSACAALCCVALALDRGPDFGIDKPAGAPCPHLDTRHSCTIHADLAARGYSGCLRYSCTGAGQRVIQDLFAGESWRDDPALLPRQIEAFRHMRKLHDLLELLIAARALPLGAAERANADALIAPLAAPLSESSAATLAAGPLPGQVRAFLRSLAHHHTAR